MVIPRPVPPLVRAALRLAVVVYGRDAGWREIGRIELPGRAAQGVVSWLP